MAPFKAVDSRSVGRDKDSVKDKIWGRKGTRFPGREPAGRRSTNLVILRQRIPLHCIFKRGKETL